MWWRITLDISQVVWHGSGVAWDGTGVVNVHDVDMAMHWFATTTYLVHPLTNLFQSQHWGSMPRPGQGVNNRMHICAACKMLIDLVSVPLWAQSVFLATARGWQSVDTVYCAQRIRPALDWRMIYVHEQELSKCGHGCLQMGKIGRLQNHTETCRTFLTHHTETGLPLDWVNKAWTWNRKAFVGQASKGGTLPLTVGIAWQDVALGIHFPFLAFLRKEQFSEQHSE